MSNDDRLAKLRTAYSKAKNDLLGERTADGHWVGELATSALSTATAVSALALMRRESPHDAEEGVWESLTARGLGWLATHQNADGGWGDTDLSHSNIATTLLVVAAFHLGGRAGEHGALMEAADRYIERQGRWDGLRRRYGKDKTFAVPILTNVALAGLVDWNEVAALPFEMACFPQSFYRFLQLPVVSYAIPALVAIGQARYFHQPPRNPLWRWVRGRAVEPSLRVLRRIQPESGGYLEAVPLTSFVVMSLAATGRSDHPVARCGTDFLVQSVRTDGSWPIDTNLATWTTSLALQALASGGDDITELADLAWLLKCQNRSVHPFTGAEPGGWGWSDLSGAVPDADDTPGALLALAAWRQNAACNAGDRARILEAAEAGVRWLLDLQNRDGGWPTFCRGWGKLPFDRSGADLTAHALRALRVWRIDLPDADRPRMVRAERLGLRYLQRQQRADGSWLPLWFGNQDHPCEENPLYGTAKVLMAYRDLGKGDSPEARRGSRWIESQQRADGGWNCGASATGSATRGSATSLVEETALAVDALLAMERGKVWNEPESPVTQGLDWLIRAVETNQHLDAAPIGFYFAKLWYYERLYPQIFTVSALGHALEQGTPRLTSRTVPAHLA